MSIEYYALPGNPVASPPDLPNFPQANLIHPWPIDVNTRVETDGTEMSVHAKISTPSGWLNLEDPVNGYALEKTTLGNTQISTTQITAQSNFVEGTVVLNSVRQQVQETLSVWVTGDSTSQLWSRRDVLLSALNQLQYQVCLVIEDMAVYFTCTPANPITITYQQEFMFARTCQVAATLNRYPVYQTYLANIEDL